MGNADEIGCRHSSGSEETEGLSEGKTSAEASFDGPCRSNDEVVRDASDDAIDEKGSPFFPEAEEIGSEPAFRADEDTHHDYRAGDTTDGALQEQTLHGHPVTVSQCKFQAHIGRISTVAEAREVSNDVLMATKREAAFSDCVAPFAYRLACVGEGIQQPPRNIGAGRCGYDEDCDGEEGYCDNGDVGSGEKLLHLLQKWDVRHRVLMVTRIDGGFMKAELMGIRRYKFVIDRAKRLLDSTDLASLRRAVATDIHQPTTAESNANLTAHVAAASGRYRAGTDAPLEDSWDQFVVPLATRRRISGHTAHGDLLGAPRASGGGAIPPPHKLCAGEGRGGLRARQEKAVGASSGTRERRALFLAQLSISSKTIPFPRGHVPSVMGDKGYGKKRGRINHFAVRTPPQSSSGDDNGHNDHSQRGSVSYGLQADEEPAAGSSDGAQGVHGKASGWSLPHELDPTSRVTDPEKHRQGSTSNRGWANCSVNTAGVSRASTCDTINSPGRVAAIMLGVIPRISGDHPLHPPPPAAAVATAGRYHPREIRRSLPPPFLDSSDGSGSLSSAGLCRGVLSRVDTASSSDGMPHCRGSVPGEGAAWLGRGRLPQRPTGGGGGGGGYTATTGADGYDRRNLNDTSEQVCPSSGIGGVRGTTATTDPAASSHGLPLLHRAPGMSVRDGTPPSLAVPTRDGGGDSGSASAAGGAPPLLSNESMMDRWKSDDDLSSSIGIAADRGVRARSEDDEDTSASEPVQNRAGPAVVVPPGRLLGGTIFVPNGDSDVGSREGRERRRTRETSTTWVADDLTDLRGMASGRSDPPPTRSKSAIRGWSVGLAVPACSPLATEKRPAACEKR